MDIEFSGEIWFWRGPAPWYFVTVPQNDSHAIKAIANLVTYGWGVIPANITIGDTQWKTSLFPKDELYLVPIRADIRKAENLAEGDLVTIRLQITL